MCSQFPVKLSPHVAVLVAEQTPCQGVTEQIPALRAWDELQHQGRRQESLQRCLPPAVHIWLGGSTNKTWAHEAVESGPGKGQSWTC